MGLFTDIDYQLKPDAEPSVSRNPSATFAELNDKVQSLCSKATWWEKWGEDCAILLGSLILILPIGLLLMRHENIPLFVLGMVCMGYVHHMFAVKGAHLFGHRSLGFSEKWDSFFTWFSTELIGTFPYDVACKAHIKIHHPHTNIIGLGDSSTWRVSFLPMVLYMLVMPLFLPLIAVIAGIGTLLKSDKPSTRLLTYILTVFLGYCAQYTLYTSISGLSPLTALLCCCVTRSIFMIPYIHVNIFQHIGLCMFDRDNRPDRLTQMSNGVLNLPRNPLLDWNFGHSIISCHVEHHLFPTLSDAMCIKVKPTVKKYFEGKGLTYHERSYSNRFHLFILNYQELMVHAPPITEFVAVQ